MATNRPADDRPYERVPRRPPIEAATDPGTEALLEQARRDKQAMLDGTYKRPVPPIEDR